MRIAILIQKDMMNGDIPSQWFTRQGMSLEEFYTRDNVSIFILEKNEFPDRDSFTSFRVDAFHIVLTIRPDENGNPKIELIKNALGNLGKFTSFPYVADEGSLDSFKRQLLVNF